MNTFDLNIKKRQEQVKFWINKHAENRMRTFRSLWSNNKRDHELYYGLEKQSEESLKKANGKLNEAYKLRDKNYEDYCKIKEIMENN